MRTAARKLGGLLLALAAFVSGATDVAAQDRARLAVIPFENQTGWWGRELGNSAASQLTTKLVGSGEFTVVERQRVDAIYDELATGQSGAVTPDQAVEIGKMLGVEYLVTGQFTHFNITSQSVGLSSFGVGATRTTAESAMDVRVISVRTGEIVAATSAEGRENVGNSISVGGNSYTSNSQFDPTLADRALGPAIETIVATLVEQGDRIVAGAGSAPAGAPNIAGLAADGGVYIDQGENFGMEVGRRFRVLRVTDVILDANGNELDRVTEPVGIIQVTRVLSQSAITSIVEGVAAEGDVLEPVAGG